MRKQCENERVQVSGRVCSSVREKKGHGADERGKEWKKPENKRRKKNKKVFKKMSGEFWGVAMTRL